MNAVDWVENENMFSSKSTMKLKYKQYVLESHIWDEAQIHVLNCSPGIVSVWIKFYVRLTFKDEVILDIKT